MIWPAIPRHYSRLMEDLVIDNDGLRNSPAQSCSAAETCSNSEMNTYFRRCSVGNDAEMSGNDLLPIRFAIHRKPSRRFAATCQAAA